MQDRVTTHARSTPLRFELGGLIYELDAVPRPHGRRSLVTVRAAGRETEAGFRDRTDLFAFRSRKSFAARIAEAFGRDAAEVLGHVAVILDSVERSAAAEDRVPAVELTSPRRSAAEKLLERPTLLELAAAAMTSLGYVGEERPKRLAYLVATSRLLPKPLSLIVLAPSGAGKSELLDTVIALMPDESVEFVSRLTPAALYYSGEHALRHRAVVVDEQAGASEADYSIRTLQSKGLLRLAVPVRGKTQPFTVRGPIALMSGTTSSDLNPENLSRCLELVLDDSPEQTARVQAAQRAAWAGRTSAAGDLQVWHDAQRVLEPLPVLIPFAELAGVNYFFPSTTTRNPQRA